MKRIIYKIIFTGIFLLTLISVSYSAEWEIYAKSILGIHYYDKENISHMPNNIIRVWEKTIYSDAGKEDAIKDLGDRFQDIKYTLQLTQINCDEKIAISLHGTSYDSKGLVIIDTDFPEDKKNIIVPDSINDDLYKIVCKKTKQE
jgi:hypothetical protein